MTCRAGINQASSSPTVRLEPPITWGKLTAAALEVGATAETPINFVDMDGDMECTVTLHDGELEVLFA